ncbi:cation efflux protein [Tuber indicum]|nr:cation efflux protein [Tuber indicum]
MAVSKGIGGWYFNSQALVADAFHALTDLVSDFMTLGTVAFALRSPTEKFPNGYGKIESLGSLGVSSLLLFGGIAMGYTALIHLYSEFFGGNLPEFLEHVHGHSHSHSHSDLGPNVNAAWLAAGSIVVKEWLYRSTMKIAKERKSSVLASNAIHHRIDSLTSIVALIAIGGAHFLQNASYLDPVGGLIVSLMVINAGWGNTRAALMELVDVGLDHEIKEAVRNASDKALALRQERLSIRAVGGSKSGQNYLVELTVEVPVGTTVRATRALEEVLRGVVGAEVRGVKRIKIRFVEEGTEIPNEFVFKEENVSSQVEGHSHDH